MNQIATATDEAARVSLAEIERTTRSPALQIMLNPVLFDKAKSMAGYLAQATGFVPKHLEGNSYACFAVVVQSLTWKMSPYAVANCTYQTPGGKVGYEGKLVHAALESSGQIEGGIKYQHYGDWSNIQGKFQKKTSQKGSEYMAPAWRDEDEEGVGVTVIAQIKGETEPRTFNFDLRQAHPRNSTLWATDPKTQICYTAVRRFANVVVPGLFLGASFDVDEVSIGTGEPYVEVNPEAPRPTRESVRAAKAAEAAAAQGQVIDQDDAEAQAEAAARQLDQQASATINGRMPDTAEERGEEVPHDEDGVVQDEPPATQRATTRDDDLEDIPPALDQRPGKPRAAARAPKADEAKAVTLTPAEWEAEAKNMVRGMLKVGNDLAQWKRFLTDTRDRRALMGRQAPEIHAKLQHHIEQKEVALRGG